MRAPSVRGFDAGEMVSVDVRRLWLVGEEESTEDGRLDGKGVRFAAAPELRDTSRSGGKILS